MATATQPAGIRFVPNGILSPDALETNRAGKLTDVQRKELGGLERMWRKDRLSFALIAAVIGGLIVSSNGPALNAWARPIVGLACFVIAGALVLYSMPGADRLSGDIRRGEVSSLEGAMEKHTISTNSGNGSLSTHYLDVADKHFEVASDTYKNAPSAGWVRIYYLPTTHKVINLERLPDPPLPADLAQPTMAGFQGIVKEITHARGAEHHEAVARMEQFGSVMKASMESAQVRNAVPPPAAELDSRPLAEAIVGHWAGGPFSVTFSADGTVEMQTFVGRAQQGRWSVDGQGKLHATLFGREEVGDAWIAGDTLTITLNGEGVKLQRAG